MVRNWQNLVYKNHSQIYREDFHVERRHEAKLDRVHIAVFVFKQHVFFLDQNGASHIGRQIYWIF